MEIKRLAALAGHQNSIYSVESSAESDFFYTAGNDKGIVQWSFDSLSPVKVLMPVKTSVYSLHIPPDGSVMASGEISGQINIYSFTEQAVIARLHNHTLPVFSVNSLSTKKELLAASEDGTVSVTDLVTNKLIYTFKVSAETVRCMAISPGEQLIAFGCKDNFIRIYSSHDYSLIKELPGHTMPVTSLCFSPDGHLLLSGGRDAKLNIWSIPELELKESITAHMFAVYDIKFHPSSPYFATCSQDKSIKIWNAETLKLLKIISREKGTDAHTHSVNKLSWNTKNGSLISVGDDRMVMIWKIEM